jgi:hypothetical protein
MAGESATTCPTSGTSGICGVGTPIQCTPAKMAMAKAKFAKGPAATTAMRCPTGLFKKARG